MADGVEITAGTGTTILTDDTGAGGHVQVVKLGIATNGSGTLIPSDGTDGLLVNLGANNDVAVTGTVAVTQSGTWDEVGINDSGNSITVDWAGTAPPIGAGVEATALRVTLATDSTGLVSIDDNGASLTVDAPVGTPVFVRLSDGGAAIATLPVSLASVPSHAVTLTSTTVTGTVAVTQSGTWDEVGINDSGNSITVDAPDATPIPTRPIITRISVASAGLDNAAYAAGETLGDLMTVTGAARTSGGGGFIVGVTLVDASDTLGAVDVIFYDSTVTLGTDNAAYAISDADALKLVAIVPMAGPYDIGNNRIAQAHNISVPFVCSGTANLFASMIARGATGSFPAATDIQLIVYVQN